MKVTWDAHISWNTKYHGDVPSIEQPPHRVSIASAYEAKQATDQLLKQDAIEKSSSAWASPILSFFFLVGKKFPPPPFNLSRSTDRCFKVAG